jgi:hypothetical protein
VAGLTSQVLVGKNGQPLSSKKSPNFINPADPPVAGIDDPAGVLASHECVLDNSQVIQAVVHRVKAGAKADRRPGPQWAAECRRSDRGDTRSSSSPMRSSANW